MRFYAILYDVDHGTSFCDYCEGIDAYTACLALTAVRLNHSIELARKVVAEGKIEVIECIAVPLGECLTHVPVNGFKLFPST